MRFLPVSVETRALWEISARPHYLVGVLAGAKEAKRHGVKEMCVVEFGVAGGNGLVALEEAAAAVESATGVKIKVVGFDSGPGAGLPKGTGDFRDHPDLWMPGDYQMDEAKLRARLDPKRTKLVFGNVSETVEKFVASEQDSPVGFVSFDLDYYSSTVHALKILSHPKKQMILNTPLYFDDIDFLATHRFAGEFLAIDEFNRDVPGVKIDRWYGLKRDRPFPERPFLDKMFVAHDLDGISACSLKRGNVHLPIS